MGLLEICSHNSYWRGLDYFENKRIKTLEQINKYEFEADVEGTETYHVHLDINHPRKSTCRKAPPFIITNQSVEHGEQINKSKLCKGIYSEQGDSSNLITGEPQM